MTLPSRALAVTAVMAALLTAVAALGLQFASAATGHETPKAATAAPGSPLVAYVRYRGSSPSNVWIGSPTGGPQRLLGPGEQPLLSPAGGNYVAAAANNPEGAGLFVYPTEGGAPRSFFRADEAIATPLAWSADGRYLAVSLLGTLKNSAIGAGLAVIDTSTWSATFVAKGIINGASFNPTDPTELVYASAPSELVKAPTNVATVSVTGGQSTLLTRNGRSLFPLWGAKGILFDVERLRGASENPEYQVWLMNGSTLTQLTTLKVPPLLNGLVPLAVSADGNRIIAQYVGEDTADAWTIQVSPLKVSKVTVGAPRFQSVQAGGISLDGTRLLVDVGGYEQAADSGTVETLAFGGGGVFKVARGADASWNA